MFACPSRLLVVLMACTLALAIPVDDNALQQGDVVRVRGKALQPPESGVSMLPKVLVLWTERRIGIVSHGRCSPSRRAKQKKSRTCIVGPLCDRN